MAVERRQAERTSFIMARETESTGSPVTDRKQAVRRRYVITAWNHDENSEKQQSDSLRAGRADVFGEDGYLFGDGNVEIEIPSESGFLDIIQGVLADPNPVSTAIPTKKLVAADTNLDDIDADDYFTDTKDATVTVVDEQDLSGAGNKTVAENLSIYKDALTLTVTPGSSAALTNTSTPGTITITYTDAAGETGTLSLSFADSEKTDAQTTELPAGATVARVRATGWGAGKFSITTAIAGNIVRNPEPDRPGRLRVKYTGALTDHTLLIRGVRRVGLASNDTLPLREEIALGSDVLSEKYFHKISKMTVKDANGAVIEDISTLTGDHKVEILAEPGGYETTLKTVNDEFPGWTLEPEVGGEPWVVTRAVPIGAEIEVGESIGAAIDILSNRVDKRRTIEGGDEEQFTPTAVKHPDEFPFVGRRFFSGYGRYLEIEGEAVICDAAPISITHNYDFSQGKIPGRFRRDTEPTARRNVTSSVQTKYESGTSEEDVFVRWDERFRNNEAVSVRIVTYQWLGNGRQLAIIYEMPNCEITSPVRVPVTGPGSIDVNIELKAVPPEGETDGELKVTIIGDDQWT